MIRKLFSTCVTLFLFTFSYSQTVTFQTDDGLTAKTICKGTEIQLNLDIDPPRPSGGTSTYNIQWEKTTNPTFIRNCQFPSADGSCSFYRDIPGATTTYTVTVNGGSSGPISESIVITVEDLADPGLNTTMFLCGRTGIINLFDELDGSPSAGGVWSNGTGTYDTSDPTGGAFTYTIDNGGSCPAVSVVLTVKPCGDNDSDNDNVPDATDDDDDNDGIPDIIEDGFCTAVTTSPIFVLEEDFGFGGPTRSRYSEGLGLTYNPLLPEDRFSDGEYNVATSTYFRTAGGFDATFLSSDLIGEVDANGDVDGRYLAINMKSSAFADKPVFVAENLPVTPGIAYDFSMSIASLNNNVGERPANLTIEVVDQTTGTPIFSQNSGEIQNGTDNWILVQSSFVPDPAVNVVTIRVINRQGTDGDGNDIGIDNIFLSTNACDFDRDGIPNSQDLDADNDGIYDIVESGNAAADGDGDGRFDGAINADGTSTTIVHNVINSDSDSNQDFLDIDADGDGIIDNIEGQSTAGYIATSGVDGDFNGVDDSYDTNGVAITPVNTNTTAAPDYIDLNADPLSGDCLEDVIEAYDIDQDGVSDISASGSDSDGDGLDDAFDMITLDRLTVETNATNGGTVPTDFPNNHNPLTDERDWREEIGDVDVGSLAITICDPLNLFEELPMGTLTTGTWSVPATGAALTGGHLGTLDPTATGVLDGEYVYTLPVLVAGCPPIRYLVDVAIDSVCTCPDIIEPTNPSNESICVGSVTPVLSVDVLTGQTANWYDADGNQLITNSTTFTPTDTAVGNYIYNVEAFDTVENCASDRIEVFYQILDIPVIDPINAVSVCESYELPTLTIGNYFTQTNGVGTQLNAGEIIDVSQVIYVYAETGTTPNCFDEEVLDITINPLPNPLAPVNPGDRFCQSYVLPALQSGQNYYTASNGGGTQLNPGDTIQASQTIFLQEIDSNGCENEVQFFVEITDIEELEIEAGVICAGPITSTSFMINTELSETDFSFEWSFEGTVITGATQSFYEATQVGTYTVAYTDIVSTCSGNSQVTIIGVNDPESLDLRLSAGAFSGNSDIIATVVGDSTYEFILDNGSPQDSNVFTNVSLGLHEVTAVDINGCGSITASIFVIGFPNFFTPNNDGINDEWGVVGNADTPEMDIFIFDKYGKLLQQLNRDNSWDGMYGGKPLPATDYWFVAEFKDGSATYRRHFTLKR
ncbi:T9SS type B sorting domain-containing protein [uncultured Aquimarina sp.]|uniref:T9SS type B sorting domain-containing protein n=1 Tax=uncultured Aquimarina sp. TaxID=575652 RepID=UPI002602A18E|nr:T9SS type B sorting domain-containing protein [uncultured Aquimarina sp.]